LVLPVGLEKRVCGDLMDLAGRLNAPGNSGYRLFPVPGEVITEIEAISLLTGARWSWWRRAELAERRERSGWLYRAARSRWLRRRCY
jgi:hypothetical protein